MNGPWVPAHLATMEPLEVDARPATLHMMAANPRGLTGMAALLQRVVVHEATVPPNAQPGQRVSPAGQPHVSLTLPPGAAPAGSLEKWINMETAVPSAWEPGVQLMTTLRSGARVRIVPSHDAAAGQRVEFGVPFSMLTGELQSLLFELDALQRALSASPDDAALRGQLAKLEGLVQRSLEAQMRPPSPPLPTMPVAAASSDAGPDEARLQAMVEAAVQRAFAGAQAGWLEAMRRELRQVAAEARGEAKQELEATMEAWLSRLLEAMQAQHQQHTVALHAWLQEALQALQQGRAAPPPTPAPKPAPPPAAPPPAAARPATTLATEAAACQAGVATAAVACQASLRGSEPSTPSRPVAPPPPPPMMTTDAAPAEIAARLISASAHLAASRAVSHARAPEWMWYHQVHAEPPGTSSGSYLH